MDEQFFARFRVGVGLGLALEWLLLGLGWLRLGLGGLGLGLVRVWD